MEYDREEEEEEEDGYGFREQEYMDRIEREEDKRRAQEEVKRKDEIVNTHKVGNEAMVKLKGNGNALDVDHNKLMEVYNTLSPEGKKGLMELPHEEMIKLYKEWFKESEKQRPNLEKTNDWGYDENWDNKVLETDVDMKKNVEDLIELAGDGQKILKYCVKQALGKLAPKFKTPEHPSKTLNLSLIHI